jgi:ketosteroid isomerase-like protein
MSNVEVIYKLTDAINRGDIEAVLECYDPEVSYAPLRATVQGTYSGHAGVREWWEDTQESFADFSLEAEEIRDIDGHRVLAIGTLRTRGQESGVETSVDTASVIEFRDGLIVALKDYGDRAKAREAAGLA